MRFSSRASPYCSFVFPSTPTAALLRIRLYDRLSAATSVHEETSGSPWLLGHPLRTCHDRPPRRPRRPHLPSCRRRHYCLQDLRYLGLTPEFPFRWLNVMAHTFAYLRINAVVTDDTARLATSLPGAALAGRDSHPLDDYSKISRRHRLPPIPLRPALPGRIRRRGPRPRG